MREAVRSNVSRFFNEVLIVFIEINRLLDF